MIFSSWLINWASPWDYGTYHMGDQRRFRPLDGCACPFKEWVYGGRKVPLTHEMAQFMILLTIVKTFLQIAIVWRQEKQHIRYEWQETGWNIQQDKERHCAESLDNRLKVLLTTDSVLPYKAELPTFYNEHGYVSQNCHKHREKYTVQNLLSFRILILNGSFFLSL